MLPDDDRTIETCRSVFSVLTFWRRNYFFFPVTGATAEMK